MESAGALPLPHLSEYRHTCVICSAQQQGWVSLSNGTSPSIAPQKGGREQRTARSQARQIRAAAVRRQRCVCEGEVEHTAGRAWLVIVHQKQVERFQCHIEPVLRKYRKWSITPPLFQQEGIAGMAAGRTAGIAPD